MQDTYKRFVKSWLGATLAALAGVVAFNLLVDPAGAYPCLHLRSLEPLRYLSHDRVHKAEMARRGGWEIIILGSSRSKAGLPAEYPWLATNQTCNLSFDAVRFPELVMAFDYARQHNRLKHVILCLDFYMFGSGPPWIQDFPESRFNPKVDLLQYYCKQLLSQASTEDSLNTLRQQRRHFVPARQSLRGFYHHLLSPGMSQRQLFDTVLRITGVRTAKQTVDWSCLDLFRQVVRTCRDEHIDLQIAIMPVHALELECYHNGGRWSDFEKWKAGLVNALAKEGVEGKTGLWDFTGYAGPPAESVPPPGDVTTRMKYFFENSHCTPAFGTLMLDSMFGAPSSDQCGIKLSRSNLTAHLHQILEDRAFYARTNAADIQWVQHLISEAAAPRK